METENSTNGEVLKSDSNFDNSNKNHVNGLNGYSSDKHKNEKSEHKSKHKDKDRERDRDKDKHKSKDHKSSSRDKDKHTSSKDKDRHSSHKSSSRDKDKERSDKDKDKDRHRDKDKHRDDKKHSSSSSKDKDRKDKDKDHKSSHDKDHKSSSRDKEHRDKDRDKDRDRSKHSSSKDKDKERDKEKSRHSSSKDKHRDKDKDKHSSSKDKEKKEKKEKIEEQKEEVFESKREPDSAAEDSVNNESMDDDDDYKLSIKEDIKDEPDSQDEADNINLSQASSCDYSMSQFSKNEPAFEDGEDDGVKSEVKEEPEEESDEDIPLSSRMSNAKRKLDDSEDEEDVPLSMRKKPKLEEKKKKKKILSDDEDEEDFVPKKKDKKQKKQILSDDEEEDYKPVKKEKKRKMESDGEEDYFEDIKKKKPPTKAMKKEKPKTVVKTETNEEAPKKGRKKKEEEEQEVWKWWEEEKKDDGTKWTFLEHKGPVFAPDYEPLPSNVKFFYNGEEMKLSEPAEEVAGFYARMLDHDYTSKEIFNTNFFKDWRKVMTEKERSKITDLNKCNFKQMHAFFMDQAEKNRNRTKEEKQALKEKNEALVKEYGFCTIDGHKEKIGNFKIEPPGLFRGRGEHPKMGKLKRRVEAEDIIINCSKDSVAPKPPPGHKWKEVRHDPQVTWLASWTENVQNQVKYIMLNPSSKLKGEKDMQKYETARRLHSCIDKIRKEYREDWKSKEMRVRQRAVALYFIDKLALRAGNEKDEDQADTVGCCSLRFEHIELHEKKDDKEFVVVFDFLGKDSIRYYNEVPVEKRVFKNLQLFMENKNPGDDLFDRLNTTIMNKHLNELMEGLTAKVFRTYNASWTLQQQLDLLTNEDDTVAEKILSYNRANRAVAILCNHQRSVPKGHQKSMEKLKEKIEAKKDAIKDAERQVKDAKRDANNGSVKEKVVYDKKKKMLERLKDQLTKLEIQETDRDENKTIALGTSKLNYLDPRISVAWCKKYDVPIEKIYNKTQRDKFRWAIDMAGPDYRF
ncbi:DNA topoisomerase I, mitochondrial isoform X1 [Coccinella septempunctata]|uniref:DNA topoisomerase I, mitochondrial isoform X1 n=1 Tax=Coccinella septempunctata TaxID=41139 RepID=UPI001D069F54|nr:DNA topoisomerase I, mitochondrial isoform X1 [Coccinella septempunctata]